MQAYAHTHAPAHECVRACMCVCVCMQMCAGVCVSVYMQLCTGMQTKREKVGTMVPVAYGSIPSVEQNLMSKLPVSSWLEIFWF